MLAVAFTSAQAVIFEDARLPLGIIFSNLAVSPLGVYLAASVDELPGADIANLSLESGLASARGPRETWSHSGVPHVQR